MIYTVVANTGIHITSFPFEINTKEKFQLWFHEWYNTENGEWTLGLVQEINDETNQYFYNKKTLFENGYLQILKSEEGVNVQDLYDEGIKPIMIMMRCKQLEIFSNLALSINQMCCRSLRISGYQFPIFTIVVKQNSNSAHLIGAVLSYCQHQIARELKNIKSYLPWIQGLKRKRTNMKKQTFII